VEVWEFEIEEEGGKGGEERDRGAYNVGVFDDVEFLASGMIGHGCVGLL